MTPKELERQLPDYADGGLPPAVRALITQELPHRPEWRDQVQRWQALRRTVGRIIAQTPVPAGLADRVRASLQTESERPAIHAPLNAWGLPGTRPPWPLPWDSSSGRAAPPPT